MSFLRNIHILSFQVQRLIEQIHGDTVALTGLQFFKVKRGIVLAVSKHHILCLFEHTYLWKHYIIIYEERL